MNDNSATINPGILRELVRCSPAQRSYDHTRSLGGYDEHGNDSGGINDDDYLPFYIRLNAGQNPDR